MANVGLIGLGAVGQFYGVNLLRKFGSIGVYDVDPTRYSKLRKKGAKPAASARELAGSSDMLVLAL